MSLQTALVAIKTANVPLNSLVGTRFHPDQLEQGTALPAIRFQVISRTRAYAQSCAPQLSHARVQMDGFAETSAKRSALAVIMRNAFMRYTGTIGGETIQDMRIEGEGESVEMLDTNTEAYRIRMDWMVDIETEN